MIAMLSVAHLGCTRSDKPSASNSSATSANPDAAAIAPLRASSEPPNADSKLRGAGPMTASGPHCVVPALDQPPPLPPPAEHCPPDPGGAAELGRATVSFPDAPSKPQIWVELAETDAARTRGLMYRTQLEDDQGMLFSWPREQRRSFWMKNTCIPLDMLFIDKEGFIVGILENVPTLNQAPRGVRCPAAHVLEVNAGWTREHGVFAGQRLQIER